MITQNGFTTTNLDPNMSRAIEELAHVINEVEQRVQLVKLGLVQGFPHLAAPLLARSAITPGLGTLPNVPLVLSPYMGQPGWNPSQGIPPTAGYALGSFFGAPGVTTPFNPLATASYSPFRF